MTETAFWLGGRIFHLIPANRALTIPCGLNRGRRWLRGAANAPEWIGIYEWRKQRALRRLIPTGALVCDIGANAGFYTLALARLVGCAGRVIAFEPLPRNLEKIRQHLQLNAVENVTLHSCALSDVNGSGYFAEGESDFTGQLSEETAQLRVATMRLDDFLSAHSLGDPVLLKIDVEGAEARLPAGAAPLLERAHPTLLLALHGREQRRLCFEILRAADYRIADLRGRPVAAAHAMPDEVIAHA